MNNHLRRFFFTVFLVGQCIRSTGSDAWESETYKILNVGKNSYNCESAKLYGNAWGFTGTMIFPIGGESCYSVITCPEIEWSKPWESK